MRIALVNRYFSETRGGVERFSVNLARQLIRHGHQVDVFAHKWDVEPDGMILHPVRMKSFFSWLKVLSFSRNVRSRLARDQYDAVYTLSPAVTGDVFRVGGLHKAWLTAKYPCAFSRFLLGMISPVKLAGLYLEKRIFAGDQFILFVANSRMAKEEIILHYGIPADRIRVVYNGVDTEVFHPGVREKWRDEVRRQHGMPSDMPVLLFLAANWKRKGLDILLRSLPVEQEYRLLVVGSKKQWRYSWWVRQHGLLEKIIFAGPTAEPWRFYGAADLFVLPTRYDAFANACLEALACGIPVITTRNNGASELIHHGRNGYIIEHPGDVSAIHGKILQFLGREDWDRMREEAARTGQRYSMERCAQETLAVLEEMLANKRGKGRSPTARSHPPQGIGEKLDLMRVRQGWDEMRHSAHVRVLRAELEDGRKAVYKEFLPKSPIERWKVFARGSRAERARRGSAILRSKGFSAPQTLQTETLPGQRSYIVSELLPGEPLEDYYKRRFNSRQSQWDAGRKRSFLREFGRTVGKIHRAGIVHGDLRGFNVLVEETETGWRFHFLDNERTSLSRRTRERFRNLVQIATISLPGLRNVDRLRFFLAYLEEWPELLPQKKRWARKIHERAIKRLKKRGRIP